MDAPALTMQTDTLRLHLLPEVGGKIASLHWLPGNLELLQAPLAPCGPRTRTMRFEESDASGFDECLPSVAACEILTAAGPVRIPDHGDFWRCAWSSAVNGNEVRLSAEGFSLPLRFERVLRLQADTLEIDYLVRNTGSDPVDYAWSAHPLFAVDPGDRILLPESVTEVQVGGSTAQRLGPGGTRHPWPRTISGSGQTVDLSVAGAPADGIGDKLFAAAPGEGWAAIERPGLRIEVRFDPARSPWLGLWLCYGGWPAGKPVRQQCVALEPCTAPVDSLAEAIDLGCSRRLQPGQSDEWPMRIRVQHVS